MLVAKLRSVGGSVMFAIPKAILEGLDMRPNAAVGLSVAGGKMIVDPHPRRRYLLAELIADCDADAARSSEDRAWLEDGPAGWEHI